MLRTLVMVSVLLGNLGFALACVACLWDRDTLAMERQRFPTALELITGKFLRHSADFYRWRVTDRRARITTQPTPDLYDDLAVALDKIGDTEEAIRVTEAKAAIYPGLYSTHANLGTFYFHAGKFGLGLPEIEKALTINPEAHFGREIYQKRLVEYLLRQSKQRPPKLPLSEDMPTGMGPVGFARFLLDSVPDDVDTLDPAKTIDKGITGILGMLKFGNHDSPILLEALGDLLVSRGYDSDGKQLAARAYLKASYEAEEPTAQRFYRDKAKSCLEFQTIGDDSNTTLKLGELEKQFATELLEARSWHEAVAMKEKAWLAAGQNVEEEFEREFYKAPTIGEPPTHGENYTRWFTFSGIVVTACVVIPLVIIRKRRHGSRQAV